MSQYDSLNEIHIVSHGNSGKLFLGNTILDSESLSRYKDELNSWGDYLEEDGDILLYGCNVAADLSGAEFVKNLSQYAGADISASVDDTGKDGDWELEAKLGKVEATSIFNGDIDSAYQHTLQIFIEAGIDDGFEIDNGFDDAFNDQIDDALFGSGDDEVDASDYDSFANVPADNLVNLAENGLNFAEVSPNVLATIDFNNIPAEDFQILRNAGLSLTPLSSEALANVNLSVFKNFDYLSQIDLSQTRFNNLTLFGELSTTFAANDNLYTYKAELEIGSGLNLDKLVQLSFSDFQAVNYAFDGDEIFDSVHYTAQRKTLDGVNPFTDYSENGWKLGLDPHPLFDVDYYLGKNTDVRDDGAEPLRHYILTGYNDPNPNRDPHALFDTSYYQDSNTDIVNANKNPLLHYIETGYSEDFNTRDPNRYFDSSYYNANNPDVVDEGVNPLIHYIQFGWRESLPDNPGGTNPNRDPNALFDTEFYFATHIDVKDEVVLEENFNANPLQHYLEFGVEGIFANENRITHPIFASENQVAYTTTITADSPGFAFAQNRFAELNSSGSAQPESNEPFGLNFELTAREQGGILVASPTLLFNPFVVKAIEYTIYAGVLYLAGDRLDVPEGVVSLYEAITDTTAYETFSISLDNIFTGTPPFDGDIVESTPEIESFPKGSTLENLLDLDGRFYTPLDPINELTDNVETFPQRDEILDSIVDEPLVFPGEQAPVGSYLYPTRINGCWYKDFTRGEDKNIVISPPKSSDFVREQEIINELANPSSGLNSRTRGKFRSGRKNVGFADYSIEGKTGTIKAFSGVDPVQGYAPYIPEADSEIESIEVGGFSRQADSEAKILEEILVTIYEPGDTGTIRLVSTNPLCNSCGKVVEDFVEAVKDSGGDITVEVIQLNLPI